MISTGLNIAPLALREASENDAGRAEPRGGALYSPAVCVRLGRYLAGYVPAPVGRLRGLAA